MRYVTADAGCNVYVSSLPLHFTDQQLFDLFAPYGNITSARIMRAKDTRKSKGYGFVLFKDATAASRAITALHGLTLYDSRLQVRLAHVNASSALRKISKKQAALSEAMERQQEGGSGQDTPLSDSFSQLPAVPQTAGNGLTLPAPSASTMLLGAGMPTATFAPVASTTQPLLLDPATNLLLQGAGASVSSDLIMGNSNTSSNQSNMIMMPNYMNTMQMATMAQMNNNNNNNSSNNANMNGMNGMSGMNAFPTAHPVLIMLPDGSTAIAYGL